MNKVRFLSMRCGVNLLIRTNISAIRCLCGYAGRLMLFSKYLLREGYTCRGGKIQPGHAPCGVVPSRRVDVDIGGDCLLHM